MVKDSQYEICIFETLEDFLKCEEQRVYCMKVEENRYILFSGTMGMQKIILYCYFLDKKPTPYIGLDKKTNTIVFLKEYQSDALPVIFVKKSTLVSKILEHYKGKI